MEARMVGTFDLERYLRNSKKVDISDIDLSQAAQYPLTEDEIHCLTYMMDIESHTMVYLQSRSVQNLNACSGVAYEHSDALLIRTMW